MKSVNQQTGERGLKLVWAVSFWHRFQALENITHGQGPGQTPGASFIKLCVGFTIKDGVRMKHRKCSRTKIFRFIKQGVGTFYAGFPLQITINVKCGAPFADVT